MRIQSDHNMDMCQYLSGDLGTHRTPAILVHLT
uniref:Uncharacterized protein n=1 Tax=Rhizophora mucronata TaxID=61149 RepID=A0A2P2NWQ5_RHIMU